MIALALYVVGLVGFVLNRRHVLLALLSIELMLLAATLLVLVSSTDLPAVGLGAYSIVLAGAESAVGLSLVVAYNRSHGQIYLS